MDMTRLREDLEADEGRRHVPYKDQFGNWTCGIGHEMNRSPYPKEYWSDAKIDSTFETDIKEALADIEREPWWLVLDTDRRQRALVNMIFNLGHTRLSKFTTFLRLLEDREWKKAGADLRGTLWYRQVPARASRIIQLLT